jgi:cyanophycin synthetase
VKWDELGTIPIALVTGTNGKTTSARLLARMVKESGKRVGCTSSDSIMIGGEVVDTGDWTGPAAARAVLRRKDVEIAVLETARGGLLRRGLAMDDVDAALITNVSEDHTGGYGIDDLAAMTMVKAIVARAVRSKGTIVLSAHDHKLVRLRDTLMKENPDRTFVLFADLERGDAQVKETIAQHQAQGSPTVTAENGMLAGLIDVTSAPITFRGVARYNVENALGAIAMARALGVGDDAIRAALAGFGSSPTDNPRRGTLVEKDGARVMLDFGHNPEGVRAVLSLVDSLRRGTEKGRLFVVAGAAGDRTNDEIGRMCTTIAKHRPHRVYRRELAGYMRGRMPGEMSRLFRRSLTANGVADSAIVNATSEAEAVEKILSEELAPGDFAVVLVHLDHEEVQGVLSAASWPS